MAAEARAGIGNSSMRLREVADAPWCADDHARSVKEPIAPVIETVGLTKRYGGVRGIEDVSMVVEPGEVFGFLGPNGAGKTTMIRTLLDLLHPTSGSARIFGLDSRRDSVAIHTRLGNLPGEFAYEPRMSGHELVSFLAAVRGVPGLGRARLLSERFEADMDRPLGELSRGNRQKIGLVQAAFHEPELLVLDEPTGGLDPLMQEEFLAFVAEERDRGRTVFLSSHELDEVERVCDRVGIIRAGRLVAVEDVADVTRRSFRHVTVEFAEPVDSAEFRRIPGVSELEQDGARLIFKAQGDLDRVVKAAARRRVVDIELVRPTLEETFLTYYGRHGRP
jgi:ABC-2 type transport system ATP-binding protein